jgi:UDP-N-acetylglucosamine acyltransferase
MNNIIHPTAIIGKNVQIGKNITIGPFCHIEGNITIGDNTKLHSNVVISGSTKIGKNNIFFPFSVIGITPQDLKFDSELSTVEIGDNNIFREHVTIHSGTNKGNKASNIYNLTKISNNSLFMVGCHIAHDCYLQNNIILANNATLAGHVTIEEHVIIGGLSAIQQFVRIGAYSIIGGMSGVESNVVPFSLVSGERATLNGINIIGLKRHNFSLKEIKIIKSAINKIFNETEHTLSERVEKVSREHSNDNNINLLIKFIKEQTNKSFCKTRKNEK